ncbi:4182_t:CDS:1, partial [Gigaspora rosea]
MEILIANCFENKNPDCVRFSGTLKFDVDFVNILSENQEAEKEVIYHIAESLLL